MSPGPRKVFVAVRIRALFVLFLMIVVFSATANFPRPMRGDPILIEHGNGLYESVWNFQEPTNYTLANATIENGRVVLNSTEVWRNQTSQEDFENATQMVNIDTSSSPGEIKLSNTSSAGNNSYTIQPGAFGTKDSFIMSGGGQNMNYGSSNRLQIAGGAPNNIKRIVIQFNLSSIPPTARVSQAILQLYFYQSTAGNSTDVRVHRVTHWWSEMDVTYLSYDGTNPWASIGGDFDNPSYDTATLVDGEYGWVSWDITPLLQSWLNGSYANHGLLLKQVDDDSRSGIDPVFYSSDDLASPERRPRLLLQLQSVDLISNGAFSADLGWSYEGNSNVTVNWNSLEQNVIFGHSVESHPPSVVEVISSTGGGTGGDGDPVDELRWDDENRFVVEAQEDMFINRFELTGSPGRIRKVTLNAQYQVEATDYSGMNALEYSDCLGVMRPSEIQPLPYESMDTNKSYDITDACSPWTWLDISELKLYFLNDDTKSSRYVAFDRIWLTLEIETFNQTAYLNQTLSKSIRTGILDTDREDFEKGNLSRLDIDSSPGDVILESTMDVQSFPIQPGPVFTKDSTLSESLQDMNLGASPSLELRYTPTSHNELRAIIEFTTITLPKATLNSAFLKLYFYQDSGVGNLTVSVNRILSPWEEASVTWKDRMTGQPWSRPGGEINMWSYDTKTLVSGSYGWVEWDVTELVRGWMRGDYPNCGLMLRAVGGETGRTYSFYSSDSPNPTEWPTLLLNISARMYEWNGTYLSPVKIYNPDQSDAYIHWSATTLPGLTYLLIQTRTGYDPDPNSHPDLWEQWKPSSSYTNSSGQLVESSPAPYIQYRVVLGTISQNETPVLKDISISWREIELTFERFLGAFDGLTVTNLSVSFHSQTIWSRTNLTSAGWRSESLNISRYLGQARSYGLSFQLRLGTNGTSPSKLTLFLDNVTTFGVSQGFPSGTFYSQVLNASSKVSWGKISWNSTIPPNTWVVIGTRTGLSPIIDGNWSLWSTYRNSSGESIRSPSGQYLQYKVYLVTTDPSSNPSVSDVNISFHYHAREGVVETADFTPANVTSWDIFNREETLLMNTSIEYFYSTDSGVSWSAVQNGENLSLVPIPKIRFKAHLRTENGGSTPVLLEMSLLYWSRDFLPLDHIHMSLEVWTGSADDWLDIDAVGHAANHEIVPFQEEWSTTDPKGRVSATGLYEPGAVGSWRVYCNNSDDSVTNYTTVIVLPGRVNEIVVNPWQVLPITTDDEILFHAEGYDSDLNLVGPVTANWSVSGGIGTVNSGPSNSSLFSATSPGIGRVIADDGLGHTNSTDDIVVTLGAISRVGVEPWDPGSMTTDETQVFNAYYYDSDGNLIGPASVLWSVNGGIGTISRGPSTSETFDPQRVGTGNISCDDGIGHKNFTRDFEVVEGELDYVLVTPNLANLVKGEEKLFFARGFDSDGNPVKIVNSSWETNAGTIISSNVTYATLKAGNVLLSKGWIRITATSQGNATGSATVNVVEEWQNPSITSKIPDQVKIEDYGSWVLDLGSYASDPQDDLSDLSWYFIGVDRSIVKITGENVAGNHLITFTTVENAYGSSSASVWLKDSDGNVDSQLIWINITPVNDRPHIESITPFSLHYGIPYPYYFYDYVSDVETSRQELNLTCEDPEHSIVNGLWITFTYPEEFLGQTVYPVVTVKDEEGAKSSTLIAITVTDDNVPVLEVELPDVTLYEDQWLEHYFDLDEYFSDPDGDSLYYVHGNAHVNITIHDDHTVDFWAESNWFGVEEVSFRAIDPHNARAEDIITVTVLPVNDPPRISGVPDLTVHYDTASDPNYNYTFDLSPYISDVDNSPEELVVSTNYPSYMAFYPPLNLVMTIHFPESMKGMTLDIAIAVSDGEAIDTDDIKLTISEDWPPELVRPLTDVVFYEDTNLTDAFNISAHFWDRDGDLLIYSYGNQSVIVDIDNETGNVSFFSVEDWFGSEKVTFRATDPYGGIAESWITVTVLAVNDEPKIKQIPKQVVNESETWTLDLRQYIYDVDNNFSELEITLTNGHPGTMLQAGGIVVFEYSKDIRHDFVLVSVFDGEWTSYASFEVEILPRPASSGMDVVFWVWLATILVLASIIAATLAKKGLATMKIEDAYVIYRSGKLIDHITRRKSLKVDEDIFSAMLTAVKEYADGSLSRAKRNQLRTLEFGKKRILIEEGKFIYLAIVYTGIQKKKNLQLLREVLERVEKRYESVLVDWSGSLEELSGLQEEVKRIFGAEKEKVRSSMEEDMG